MNKDMYIHEAIFNALYWDLVGSAVFPPKCMRQK